MSIRNKLKQREEKREAAKNGGGNDFPEGVTRYVRMGKHGEVNTDGKNFVILADPDNWFFYFVHEDKTFNGRTIHNFRKHTCLHSPKGLGADYDAFEKPNKDVCISCKAKAKRKLYFMIPVYDAEYKTFRIIDTAEFHANNLIADYDKLEKAAKKFNKGYSLVGDAIHIKQVDKSFALESADLEEYFGLSELKDEKLEQALEKAKAEIAKFIDIDYGYEELANFREDDDIRKILEEATEGVDKSVLGTVAPANENVTPIDLHNISDDDLPF